MLIPQLYLKMPNGSTENRNGHETPLFLSETHIIDPFVSSRDILSTIYFFFAHYLTAIDKIRLPFFYLKFRA